MLDVQSSPAGQALNPLQAETIAASAYIFGFPLVLLDAVHTAVAKQEQDGCCYGDQGRAVFCLDLARDAFALRISHGHLQLRDAWTNVIASFGTPGTERASQAVALVGPRWGGQLPAGFSAIGAPTSLVSIVASGAGHPQTVLVPLPSGQAAFRKAAPPVEGWLLPAAVGQVLRMGAGTYLSRLARLMRVNPPGAADEPMLARLRRIGIAPGEPTRLACLPANLKLALVAGIAAGRGAMTERAQAGGSGLFRGLPAQAGTDHWGRALWAAASLFSALPAHPPGS